MSETQARLEEEEEAEAVKEEADVGTAARVDIKALPLFVLPAQHCKLPAFTTEG